MKNIITNIFVTIIYLFCVMCFGALFPIWLSIDLYLWIVSDTKLGAFIKWIWNLRKRFGFR